MKARNNSTGFTIVELLIVVVVIAILAAITIVAYNGIRQRADTSALQSAASQAAKKAAAYFVEHNESYPESIGDLALPVASDKTYTYKFNNTTSPKNYCLSVAKTGEAGSAQAVSSASSGVIAGLCMENYILNPSFESGSSSNGANISATSGSLSAPSDGSVQGQRYLRMTATSASASGMGRGQFSPTLPNGRYTGSFWVRSNKPINFHVYLEGSAAKTNVSTSPSNSLVLTPNTWTRFSRVFDITSPGTVKLGGYCPTCSSLVVGADYIDMDGFMLTDGDTTYQYADSDTPGWYRNDVEVHNATSTGPARIQ